MAFACSLTFPKHFQLFLSFITISWGRKPCFSSIRLPNLIATMTQDCDCLFLHWLSLGGGLKNSYYPEFIFRIYKSYHRFSKWKSSVELRNLYLCKVFPGNCISVYVTIVFRSLCYRTPVKGNSEMMRY